MWFGLYVTQEVYKNKAIIKFGLIHVLVAYSIKIDISLQNISTTNTKFERYFRYFFEMQKEDRFGLIYFTGYQRIMAYLMPKFDSFVKKSNLNDISNVPLYILKNALINCLHSFI